MWIGNVVNIAVLPVVGMEQRVPSSTQWQPTDKYLPGSFAAELITVHRNQGLLCNGHVMGLDQVMD